MFLKCEGKTVLEFGSFDSVENQLLSDLTASLILSEQRAENWSKELSVEHDDSFKSLEKRIRRLLFPTFEMQPVLIPPIF
jgi:hypothetical protein